MPTKEEMLSQLESYNPGGEDDPVLEKLQHYGILGMKWGVRRDQRTLDRLAGRKPGKPRPSRAQQKANRKRIREKSKEQGRQGGRSSSTATDRRSASRNRRSLSTSDIKQRIQRFEDEKKLVKLTNEDLRPFQTKLASTLSDAGWQVGKNVATAGMTVLVRKYLAGETLSRAEIGKYLKPKK